MFIMICVNNFANMSGVVPVGMSKFVIVPYGMPLIEWVNENLDSLKSLLYKASTTLQVPLTSRYNESWHSWTFEYSLMYGYSLFIDRKPRKRCNCIQHDDYDDYYDEFITCYMCGSIYDGKYNSADIKLILSQIPSGTYINISYANIGVMNEIPAEVINLFIWCDYSGHYRNFNTCEKFQDCFKSYKYYHKIDCGSSINLFKGFIEDDRNWSITDKTDEIGANPILVVLFLAIKRMELSGNFTSISILDWLELLKNVRFSMFHY